MKRIILIIFTLCFVLDWFGATAQEAIILDHKDNIRVTQLRQLNTRYREVNLNISPDGRYLYFMSCRGGAPWSRSRVIFGNVEYDGDIYFSRKNADDEWSKPQLLSNRINTAGGEDEPNISPDGQTVYYQSWRRYWENNGGPYYQAQLHDTVWSNPHGMGGGITNFFRNERRQSLELATDGMSVGPHGKRFIVAYSRDYDGEMDLFMSTRSQPDSEWGPLKRLDINTEADERSIFIAADGHTIYFASSGYGGFGGLDIFKTTIDENDRHGEIYNIGKPFNTPEDDFGFVLAASGRAAYFVRNDDIFYADITAAVPELKPRPVKLITGKILDSLNRPMETRVELFQNGYKITESRSNGSTGSFTLVTEKTGSFDLKITPEGYESYNEHIQIDGDDYEEITLKISVPPLKETTQNSPPPAQAVEPEPEPQVHEKQIVVLFDTDKSDIKPQYAQLMQETVATIGAGNIKRITIEGHTDSDASRSYNMQLGQRRANSVSEFLEKTGVDKALVESRVSFGEDQPTTSNTTEEGKQQNRRAVITFFYSE